jgi:hypothetical protein
MKFTENYIVHVKKSPDFSSFTCPEVRIVDVRTQNTGKPKKIQVITSDNREGQRRGKEGGARKRKEKERNRKSIKNRIWEADEREGK